MTQTELNEVIGRHRHWLKKDCIGWEEMRANLPNQDLKGLNFRGANLRGADLSGANLNGAKNIPYLPFVCPEKGNFIAFKKARIPELNCRCIVKLAIPADAKRGSAATNKCRCDKAMVLGFYDIDGNQLSNDTKVYSWYDNEFKYKVGEMVSAENFDENRWAECAPGIHFFMTFEEAANYTI